MQNCLSKESLLSSRKEQNPAKNKSVFLTMILKKKKLRKHFHIMLYREQELGYQCLCSGIHQMSEMEGVAAGIL